MLPWVHFSPSPLTPARAPAGPPNYLDLLFRVYLHKVPHPCYLGFALDLPIVTPMWNPNWMTDMVIIHAFFSAFHIFGDRFHLEWISCGECNVANRIGRFTCCTRSCSDIMSNITSLFLYAGGIAGQLRTSYSDERIKTWVCDRRYGFIDWLFQIWIYCQFS